MIRMTIEISNPYLLAHHKGARPSAPQWFHDALANEPKRSYFPSQGAQIELLTWGDVGKPGLLFLAGNGAHADWWSAIVPFFAADFRCAATSWSGMGRSGRREEGYLVTTFAQEARDAIAAAALDKGPPPIIIGHSMGGLVAAHAFAGHDSIGGLILVDSPMGMAPERRETLRSRAPKSHSAHRPFATLEEGLARFRLAPPQDCANDYMVDHIARTGLIEEDGAWVWHFDPRRLSQPDESEDLPVDRITRPMAYVYGERSSLLTAEMLTATSAMLPKHTPIVEIPDAAHHLLFDQPLALVAVLRTLLACWPGVGETWPK
jgi:pimeloyl-ACP methyl ester carboxylesterase